MATAKPYFPNVTFAPHRKRDRILSRKREAFAAVSADLYLLTSDAEPSNFLDFRKALRFDLVRGGTTITSPFESDCTSVYIATEQNGRSNGMTLKCDTADDAALLVTQLQTATAPLSKLQDAIASHRRLRVDDSELRSWLNDLRTPAATAGEEPEDRESLILTLQNLASGLKGSARLIQDAPEWASALSTAVSGTSKTVKALEKVLGSVPVIAPAIAVTGLAADVAALCVARAGREGEMRALSTRCAVVMQDVVTALFFCLDFQAVEQAVVDKLFTVLDRVFHMAVVAERFVMTGKVGQMLTAEQVATLTEQLGDIEALVTSFRILQYVQQNHVRNQKVDVEKDTFRRSFLVSPVPSFALLEFDGEALGTPEAILRDKLFDVACTSGLVVAQGMPGVGKSTILKGIANDAVVRRYFDGGIYEMPIGGITAEQDIIECIASAVNSSGGIALSDKISACDSLGEAVLLAKDWFFGHRCLFIWDNVQASQASTSGFIRDLRGIVDLSVGAKALVATVGSDVLQAIANRRDIVNIALRDRNISQRIFCKQAQIDVEIIEKTRQRNPFSAGLASFDKLMNLCGGLPLSLSLFGQIVSQRQIVENIDPLVACVELMKRESETNSLLFDALDTNCGEEYAGFRSSVDAIWNSLVANGAEVGGLPATEARHMHAGLCVLENGQWANVSVISKCWGIDSRHAEAVIVDLSKKHLVDMRRQENRLELRVHALMRAYCTHCALELDSYESSHKSILNGYMQSAESEKGYWQVCENLEDAYLRENFVKLLVRAGLAEEVHNLLFDFRWIKLCLDAQKDNVPRSMNLLLNDYCVPLETWYPQKGQEGDVLTLETREALQLILDSLSLAAERIINNYTEAAFQLQGRLVGKRNVLLIHRFLVSIETHADQPRIKSLIPSLAPVGSSMISSVDIGWPISDMALIPFSSLALVGGKEGAVILDLEKRVVVRTLQKPERGSGEVESVAVTPQGKHVICAWANGIVGVWDLDANHEPLCIETCAPYQRKSVCLAALPDGKRIVTGSATGKVCLWNLESGKQVGEATTDHGYKVDCVSVSNDGTQIAFAFYKTIRVWNPEEREQMNVFELKNSMFGIKFVTWTPDDSCILFSCEDNSIAVHPVRGKRAKMSLKGHNTHVVSGSVSDDGRFAVTGSLYIEARVWDLENGHLVGDPLRGHADAVSFVGFWGSRNRIVTASNDGTIKEWRHPWGTHQSFCHNGSIRSLAACAEKGLLASCSIDKTVEVWDMDSGTRVVGPLRGENRRPRSVGFSADGSKLACGYDNGNVWVWNTPDGTVSRKGLKCSARGVRCMEFSPDGSLLATGGADFQVSIWNIAKGKPLFAKMSGHKNWVTVVSFSSSGKYLVSVSINDCIRFWDVQTGEAVGNPVRVSGRPYKAMFVDGDSKVEVHFDVLKGIKTFLVDTGEEVASPSTAEYNKEHLIVETDSNALKVSSNKAVLGRFDHKVSTQPVVDAIRNRVWVGLENGTVTCVELMPKAT